MSIAGAYNRPPILEKSMYDSWKSHGTTRTKKNEELSVSKKLQADCDLKATNTVLQGLPPDVYATVNHHKVSIDIYDRVKLLMQGMKFLLQERKCKLYDEFDKFSFVKAPHLSQPQISHSSVPPSKQYQSHMNHQTSSVLQIAYHSPQVSTQPMTKFPQLDAGLAVLVFTHGDDPIACLNKGMAFLSAVVASRVTMQQVQRRQGQSYAGTGYKGNATSSERNNAGGRARVVKFYNCQGEWHMARQCTQPKRPRNSAWFKDKAMLAEAHESGQILDEEQLAFLADPGILDDQAAQKTIPNNDAF
nr:hypothetical protein [Tanacetum cinerariifolium]